MKRLALCAAALLLFAVPVSAQVILSTDFEPPTYAAGELNGQDGWVSSSTNGTVTALPEFVISGTQSLLMTGNAGRNVTHPLVGAGDQTQIEITMAKADVNAAQWWVALQSGSSNRSAVFGFNGGYIEYYEGGPGWTQYATFNAAEAYTFKAVTDIANHTYALWVNGTLVRSDIATFHDTATAPAEVYLYRGYLSITGLPAYANYGVADDLKVTVVPEPASMLTLLACLGGMAGLLRRK